MSYAYANPFESRSGTVDIPAVRDAGFTERHHRVLRPDGGAVSINYVAGPDNGPPLVLLPAQMGTWESYQTVLVPLSNSFQVYAVDVRGHGKSTWTPGDYSWASVGADMRSFLTEVVTRPAVVSGNSSGGIIALWCAANVPDLVSGAILEDAPMFSAELPRFREHDRFVYQGLVHLVDTLGDLQKRDLADYFRGVSMPVSERRTKRMPDWAVDFFSMCIRRFERVHPGEPIEIGWWPLTLRLLFKSLSMFDPDFSRAFVDGRFYAGLDHAEALGRVRCPLLVLHADWHRYPDHGLVGAMDDDDAARIKAIAPHSEYLRIPANHVIHMYKPKQFIAAVETFGLRAGSRASAATA